MKNKNKKMAKEYLNEIKWMDLCINQKQIEYENMLKSRTYISGTYYSGEHVQTTQTGNGFTSMSDKLLDIQANITTEIDKFYEMKHDRINQIQQLSKNDYIEILFKRYIEYKNFSTISSEMGYVYNYTCQLHGYALKEFEKKFLTNLK